MGDNITISTGVSIKFGDGSFSEWERNVRLKAAANGWDGAFEEDDHPMSAKLMNLIQSTLSGLYTVMTAECQTAKSMYDTLKGLYMETSVSRTQELQVAFFTLKQERREDVAIYAARLKGMVADLKAAGITIEDAQQTRAFLAGLQPLFETQAIMIQDTDPLPSIKDILPRLMRHQATKAGASATELQPTVFYTRGFGGYNAQQFNQRPSYGYSSSSSSATGNLRTYDLRPSSGTNSNSSNNRSDPRACLYCHKPGHLIKDCRTRIAAEARKANPKPNRHGQSGGGNRNNSSRPSTPRGNTGNGKTAIWMAASNPVGAVNEWFFDTGSSWNVTGYGSILINPTPCDVEVILGDGTPVKAECKGDVILLDTPGCRKITLQDVLYIPGFTANLLSFAAIKKAGYYIQSNPSTGKLHIYKGGDLMITAEDHPTTGIPFFESRYAVAKQVTFAAISKPVSFASSTKVTPETWHHRYGHLGYNNMAKLVSKELVKGIKTTPEEFKAAADTVCDPCAAGKFTRGPFKTSERKTTHPLQLLHSDVCGPISIESAGKARYFATLVDDFTGYSFVQPMKHKSDVSSYIQEKIAYLETQTGLKVKRFRSDNGREFQNSDLQGYLAAKGIEYQPSMAYTPEQNGVAERINRTLLDKAIPMLDASGLQPEIWAEAVVCSNYVRNLSPLAGKDYTPHEALFKEKPDVSHLATFGCRAYYSVPKILRKHKFDTPAARAIMVGYAVNGKGYRLLTTDGKIVERSSVTFDEDVFPMKKASPYSIDFGYKRGSTIGICHFERLPIVSIDEEPTTPAAAVPTPAGPAYSTRSRTNTALVATASTSEPTTYKQAVSGPDAEKWTSAMDEEISAIRSNGTWAVEFPPPDAKVLGNKWVYKHKRLGDGSTERYKARVVVKGFQQEEGRDFFEIFAPVGKYTTLRALIAKAATEGMIIHNIDISSAFLNGTLEEEVWIQQPEGYFEGKPGMACRLIKSLYGLKQAPRVWHLNLDEVIIEKDFKASAADPCLYYYTGKEYHASTYLLVYVDDVAIFSASQESIDSFVGYLKSKYKLRDLGTAELFLGISITRTPAGIKLAQERMIGDLMEKNGMQDSNGRVVPMSPNVKLTKDEESEPLDTVTYPYATLVGSMMYLANCTRPDIAYPVGVLARFMANPKMVHWQAAKGVLRYLAGTRTYGLNYATDGKIIPVGFTDSDFAGDIDTRRSTAGYTFLMANGAISWSSKRQATVATSTTEAEYIASAAAVKEALWLRVLLRDIGYEIKTMEIKGDNQSALALLKNSGTSSRAKHIDVAHHFARERVQLGDVAFDYVPTDKMVADGMTKALPVPKFKFCAQEMGVF